MRNAILAGVLALVGCTSVRPIDAEFAQYLVPIRADGSLARLRTTTAANAVASAPEPSEQARFAEILGALRAHATTPERKRLLLFIHGGLNAPDETVLRTQELAPKILEAGYFPIFVTWNSSLQSTYREHLLSVRQGRRWNAVPAAVTAPLVLGTDAMRAVARAPFAIFRQLAYATDGVGSLFVDEDWRDVERRVERGGLVVLDSGSDQRTWLEQQRAGFSRALFFPTQLASAGLLDAVGKSAWDMMLRRTELMFHLDSTDPQRLGALARFLDELAAVLDPEWEVVLIGHSMGTIVLNRVLTEYDRIDFDRVVYMAAACSVDDYEDAVFPYLLSHPGTQMYHLTLHHKAEQRETYIAPLLQGSLLVWIDDFLANPLTFRGRTAGRYMNLITAAESTPAPLRSRVHVKEYDAGSATAASEPQTHGAFTQCSFWQPDFWQPDAHPAVCQ